MMLIQEKNLMLSQKLPAIFSIEIVLQNFQFLIFDNFFPFEKLKFNFRYGRLKNEDEDEDDRREEDDEGYED